MRLAFGCASKKPEEGLTKTMKIGIPKEIHVGETRVAATPETVTHDI